MSAPGFRQLLTLAWPLVLARSSQSVIGFSDAAMVAPLGDDALAAATTGALNATGLIVLPMGLVFIVQSYSAQLSAAGDLDGARRYAWYGLILAVVSGALAVLAIPAIEPALALTSHSEPVCDAMWSYMAIRMFSVGAIVANEALGNWFTGLGDTRVAMRASLTAMVVNIALNWVLIYGNLGAPALGVDGAAWASVLATVAGLAVSAGAFWRASDGKRLGALVPGPIEHPLPLAPTGSGGRLRLRELGRMLRFGLPYGLNWFLEFSAFLIFINFLVAELGTVAVAAMMAVAAVNSLSYMPAFGLATAGAVLVGQAIGADRRGDVPTIVRRTFFAAALWQGLVGIAYFAVPVQLMQLFARDEVKQAEGVAELGAKLLAISAAWQLFEAMVETVSEALRAAGDTAWTLWARILLAWLVWLPLVYASVFVVEGGATAATWSMVVYFLVLALTLMWRFRSGAWTRIDLTGKSSGAS